MEPSLFGPPRQGAQRGPAPEGEKPGIAPLQEDPPLPDGFTPRKVHVCPKHGLEVCLNSRGVQHETSAAEYGLEEHSCMGSVMRRMDNLSARRWSRRRQDLHWGGRNETGP